MMLNRTLLLGGLLTSSALVPPALYAAEDGAAAVDDQTTIIVDGKPIGQSFTVERAIGALKMDVPLIKTPQSVVVIPEEIILAQASGEMSDVLRNVSGITDQNSFGGVQDNFNLRGFNTDNNEILRDGFQSISDRSLTANVERVEVLKGPSSLLYGRFSPGGLINVVTKKPQDQFAASLSTIHSTRGVSRQTLDVTGPVAEGVAARLVGEYEDSDAWRNVGRGPKSIFLAPSIRLGNTVTSLVAQYEYFDNKQGFDRGRVAFNGEVVKIPATRSLGEDFAYFDQTTHNANLALDHQLSGTWKISAKLAGQWSKTDDLQVRPNALLVDAAGKLTGFFRRNVDGNRDGRRRAYYGSVNIGGKVDTGGLRHNVLVGVDYNKIRRSTAFQLGGTTARSDFNIFDPVYGLLDATVAQLVRIPNSNSISRSRSIGIYAQDLIEVGEQWSLLIGGRYDRFKNYAQSGVSLPTDDSKDSAFVPRVAALYQPIETVSIYASYSRSFKPNVSTPPDPGRPAFGPFPPEKGRGYEIGVKASLLSRLNVTLAAFDIKKQNVLQNGFDGNGNAVTTASAEVTSKGVELDIAGEITPELSVIASYAYIKARNPQNADRQRVLNVAPHKATISAVWRPTILPGASLGGGVFHYAKRYGGSAGSSSGVRLPFYLDAYTTAELYGGYEFALGAGRPIVYTRVTLRNLTNRNYDQISNGDLRIDPGQPRTLFGTLGVRF